MRMSDQRLFIVESLQGRRFRDYCTQRDEVVARKYFRSLTMDYRFGLQSKEQLQRILGQAYAVEYEAILQYIPRDQIVHIDRAAIGSGATGSVYAAKWQRPSDSFDDDDDSRPVSTEEVVIKHLHDTGSDRANMALHREVLRFPNVLW